MSIKTLYCFSFLFVTSCLSEDELIKFTTDELTFLLANDSSKTWVLTNRIISEIQSDLLECEKDDRLIFRNIISAQDTLKVQFETGSMRCPGQADSIIYQGYWMVLDSTHAYYLHWVVEGDTSIRSLNFISSELLNMSYSEGNKLITEDFTTSLD